VHLLVDVHTVFCDVGSAVDGFDITPVVAESFIITPGERYNFIIDASQPVGNYWVRGETLDREFMKRAEAIFVQFIWLR
jgi:hypothetical protein